MKYPIFGKMMDQFVDRFFSDGPVLKIWVDTKINIEIS